MHRPPAQPRPSDLLLGLIVWVLATLLIVGLVGPILPGPSDGTAIALTGVLVCVVTLAGAAGLALGWARLTGERLDATVGLRLGTALLVGLLLDGVLIAAMGFAYPRADDAQTRTIAIAFLLAYPMAVAGPWAVGMWAESRRTVAD